MRAHNAGTEAGRTPNLSRRALLAAAGAGAGAAALGRVPGIKIPAGEASTIAVPPNFPAGVSLYQQT